MLSLSEKNDDILMWGHYADGHKGYCLEFDRAKLKRWANSLPGKLEKVVYNDSYPSLKDFMDIADQGEGTDLDPLFLLRKSSHWEYESEWRVIVPIDWSTQNPQTHCFLEEMISGIIFGCEMEDENVEIICKYLNNWEEKPLTYKAQLSKDRYAVEIARTG